MRLARRKTQLNDDLRSCLRRNDLCGKRDRDSLEAVVCASAAIPWLDGDQFLHCCFVHYASAG
ncbi:MAG: hypothetical protein WBC25_07280 [Candidatus Acidiferrum sp.]